MKTTMNFRIRCPKFPRGGVRRFGQCPKFGRFFFEGFPNLSGLPQSGHSPYISAKWNLIFLKLGTWDMWVWTHCPSWLNQLGHPKWVNWVHQVCVTFPPKPTILHLTNWAIPNELSESNMSGSPFQLLSTLYTNSVDYNVNQVGRWYNWPILRVGYIQ